MNPPVQSVSPRAQCPHCLTVNTYDKMACTACGKRLPWAVNVAPRPVVAAAPLPPVPVSSSWQNDSGTGAGAVLPDELKGWSWGAFLGYYLWCMSHRIWWGFLCFLPYLSFVFWIVMGVKGNEWAWKYRRWENIEQFRKTQTAWIWGGIGAFVSTALFTVIILTLLGRKVEPLPIVPARDYQPQPTYEQQPVTP